MDWELISDVTTLPFHCMLEAWGNIHTTTTQIETIFKESGVVGEPTNLGTNDN